MEPFQWQENIIVVDAAYADTVAFNLIVNFERMLGRPVPPADMARWIDCLALDGGIRQGENHTQVVLVHDNGFRKMTNFVPGDLSSELNQQAFNDHLGEFTFHLLSGEGIASKSDVIADLVQNICQEPNVKRIMLVADDEDPALLSRIRQTLQQTNPDKHITLFTMQPTPGGNFRQEMLGFSMLSALGISSEEINRKMN